MSEWIDCFLYVIQAALLWIGVPRQGRQLARPMLTDRNPEWAAAHPDEIARVERSWWLMILPAWGLGSVLLLLAVQLGLLPPYITPGTQETPAWEVLHATSNMLLLFGMVLFGVGAWRTLRWIKRNVPLTERRHATLAPRSSDNFVPRWLKYLIYGLMVITIVSRPLVDALYPARLDNVWGATILALIMGVLAFLAGRHGVERPPNHLDRMFGPAYRKLEVWVYFGVMALFVIMLLTSLAFDLVGANPRRYISLAFLRMPPMAGGGSHGNQSQPATGQAGIPLPR
jgi:multisubunit Na+/H+ antiporter MnhB subunit